MRGVEERPVAWDAPGLGHCFLLTSLCDVEKLPPFSRAQSVHLENGEVVRGGVSH